MIRDRLWEPGPKQIDSFPYNCPGGIYDTLLTGHLEAGRAEHSPDLHHGPAPGHCPGPEVVVCQPPLVTQFR